MKRIAETGNVYISGNNASIQNAADSKNVSFSTTYDNPVIVAHTATNSGGQPVDDRVTDVSSSSFTLFAHEPDNQGHADNRHTYIVCEQGVWNTQEENVIEAGVHQTETTTRANESFSGDYVEFDYDWGQAPAVVASVNTHNNQTFSTVAIKNVTADGFEVSQLTENGQPTEIEKIGWIAFPQGSGALDDNSYEAGVADTSSVTWSASFSSAPDYVADINDYQGTDPHWIRGASNWDAADTSWYYESGGGSGVNGYVAISSQSTIRARPAQGDGTGTFLYQTAPESFEGGNLSSDWSYNNTLGTATDRVYSGSYSGRNTTNSIDTVIATYEPPEINPASQIDSFEVFYQETSSQTGHAFNIYDSSDNRIFSFGSENPQFWLRDADGEKYRPGNTSNIDAYNTWHRVTIWFDWQNGEYELEFANAETGTYDTITGNIIASDVAYINLAGEIPNTGRGGSADDLWIDNIAINNDTRISQGYSTTSDSTGGTYSGTSDSNSSVEEHPTASDTSAFGVSASVASSTTETTSTENSTALDAVANVTSTSSLIANLASVSGSSFSVESTSATTSVSVSDGALASPKISSASAATTAQASSEVATSSTVSASGSVIYDGPGSVSATVNSNTSITVSWNKTNSEANNFRVQMSRDGANWIDPASGATTSASNTSLTVYHESDNGYNEVVGIDSSYKFRVRAEGSDTSSSWNSSGTVYTPPVPPHNPSVSRPDGNTFQIHFTNYSDVATIDTPTLITEYRVDNGSGYGSWSRLDYSDPTDSTVISSWTNKGDRGTVEYTVDGSYDYPNNISSDQRVQFRIWFEVEGKEYRHSKKVYLDYGNDGNVYFEDDFESGDVSAWDSSYGGHNIGTGSHADTGVSGADQGTYYLQGYGSGDTEATWVQKDLGDLSNETDVLVKCAFAVGSMDNTGENFTIEWYDGTSWRGLTEYSAAYNEQGWFEVSEVVPDSWLSTDSRIRIGDTTASGMYGGDYFAVDRVVVSDILHEYTKPAAPTNPTTDAGFNELTLDWDHNATFSSAEEFTREGTSGSFTKRFNNPPWTWTGLKNDQTYQWYPSAVLSQDRHGQIQFWLRTDGAIQTVSTLNAQSSSVGATPTTTALFTASGDTLSTESVVESASADTLSSSSTSALGGQATSVESTPTISLESTTTSSIASDQQTTVSSASAIVDTQSTISPESPTVQTAEISSSVDSTVNSISPRVSSVGSGVNSTDVTSVSAIGSKAGGVSISDVDSISSTVISSATNSSISSSPQTSQCSTDAVSIGIQGSSSSPVNASAETTLSGGGTTSVSSTTTGQTVLKTTSNAVENDVEGITVDGTADTTAGSNSSLVTSVGSSSGRSATATSAEIKVTDGALGSPKIVNGNAETGEVVASTPATGSSTTAIGYRVAVGQAISSKGSSSTNLSSANVLWNTASPSTASIKTSTAVGVAKVTKSSIEECETSQKLSGASTSATEIANTENSTHDVLASTGETISDGFGISEAKVVAKKSIEQTVSDSIASVSTTSVSVNTNSKSSVSTPTGIDNNTSVKSIEAGVHSSVSIVGKSSSSKSTPIRVVGFTESRSEDSITSSSSKIFGSGKSSATTTSVVDVLTDYLLGSGLTESVSSTVLNIESSFDPSEVYTKTYSEAKQSGGVGTAEANINPLTLAISYSVDAGGYVLTNNISPHTTTSALAETKKAFSVGRGYLDPLTSSISTSVSSTAKLAQVDSDVFSRTDSKAVASETVSGAKTGYIIPVQEPVSLGLGKDIRYADIPNKEAVSKQKEPKVDIKDAEASVEISD